MATIVIGCEKSCAVWHHRHYKSSCITPPCDESRSRTTASLDSHSDHVLSKHLSTVPVFALFSSISRTSYIHFTLRWWRKGRRNRGTKKIKTYFPRQEEDATSPATLSPMPPPATPISQPRLPNSEFSTANSRIRLSKWPRAGLLVN